MMTYGKTQKLYKIFVDILYIGVFEKIQRQIRMIK